VQVFVLYASGFEANHLQSLMENFPPKSTDELLSLQICALDGAFDCDIFGFGAAVGPAHAVHVL